MNCESSALENVISESPFHVDDATYWMLGAAEPQVRQDEDAAEPIRFSGKVVLYVGGRPKQVWQARSAVTELGAEFLHHDGGIEDSGGLLVGLVSRADVVAFPVDCISHDAALMVKRLCRQEGKPFLPLRSSGVGSLLAALEGSEIAALRATDQFNSAAIGR